MDPLVLTRGANLALAATSSRLRVIVDWSDQTADIDASALLLVGGTVRGDADLVFYNQPSSADGAVLHLGRTATEAGMVERLAVDLAALDSQVETIAVTASRAEGTFADVGRLRVEIHDDQGTPPIRFDLNELTIESAVVLVEVYRREGAWKVRAVGRGWANGLAGLATDFGIEVDSSTEPEPAATAEVPAAAATDASSSPTPRPRRRGVQTRKNERAQISPPLRKLAADDSWAPARLFSVYGVGSGEEQEKRTTSALLSTMMSVKAFGRAITVRMEAPAGTVETFIEVPFAIDDRKAIPDGVVRVQRAGRIWTALVEVKTGSGSLRREQVELYLDVARNQGFDAVVTLSNDIAPKADEHPVSVDGRKTRSVTLVHLSWAEVLHEAQMVLAHRGVGDVQEAWIVQELIRYLEHPRSGATGFDDMGASWVPLREAVAAGTLRAGDRKVPPVADSWTRLVRQLCLRLTADLGVNVVHQQPRALANDSAARTRAIVEQLASEGTLAATLKVPGAAGTLTVVADLRTSRVRVTTRIAAPQEGGASRRIGWLLRQLKSAPDDTLVDVHFTGKAADTCERLGDVRDAPASLISDRSGEVASFELTAVAPLGTKRSGVKGAFIPSVITATESFYADVLQPLRAWVPPAPKLSEDNTAVKPQDATDGEA